MAIRNVRLENDEILRKKSRTVEVIDDKIKELVDDMIETMHAHDGVGLAAPQVGILKRVVVIDLYDDKGPYVLINPEIIKQKGEQEVEEGCLSFPNQFAKVIRPSEVTVKALDRNGKEYKLKGKLNDIYERVKGFGFLFIHKSYIVNNLYIRKYSYDNVELDDNVILPVSRQRREEIKKLQMIWRQIYMEKDVRGCFLIY